MKRFFFSTTVSVEEVKNFHDYYAMDVPKDGKTFGMLSVNGCTGDVWYHDWPGG